MSLPHLLTSTFSYLCTNNTNESTEVPPPLDFDNENEETKSEPSDLNNALEHCDSVRHNMPYGSIEFLDGLKEMVDQMNSGGWDEILSHYKLDMGKYAHKSVLKVESLPGVIMAASDINYKWCNKGRYEKDLAFVKTFDFNYYTAGLTVARELFGKNFPVRLAVVATILSFIVC